MDAFIETGNNILDGNQVATSDGLPDQNTVQKLEQIYAKVDYHSMNSESIRKAIQLVLIKAIKEDEIQANHQVTPDTIAFIMGYLVIRLLKNKSTINIFDLTVGSGNLLTAVMHQLKDALHAKINGIGIDNDDSELAVASISSQMQNVPVELMHQDAVNNILVDDMDLVMSDLPIGYYPIDANTTNYQTSSNNGHSFAHHLLIEQGMNHVKTGGLGVFLVPSNIFQSQESKSLLKWIEGSCYLQAMLNLPKELFSNVSARKSILILQKHGDKAKQAKQVMLGDFPSFKNVSEFQKFMAGIVKWEEEDLLK